MEISTDVAIASQKMAERAFVRAEKAEAERDRLAEVAKTCLTVLCAVRNGQTWSANMLKDIDMAIEGCRVLTQHGDGNDAGQ